MRGFYRDPEDGFFMGLWDEKRSYHLNPRETVYPFVFFDDPEGDADYTDYALPMEFTQ